MTLSEKYKTLTAEQKEALAAVKTPEALDAFLAENNLVLSDEEKQQAMEYFNTGAVPLSDDDLDSVAGGKGEGVG